MLKIEDPFLDIPITLYGVIEITTDTGVKKVGGLLTEEQHDVFYLALTLDGAVELTSTPMNVTYLGNGVINHPMVSCGVYSAAIYTFDSVELLKKYLQTIINDNCEIVANKLALAS